MNYNVSASVNWYNECLNYDYTLNTPLSGTGHFTALIWKNTSKVGFGFFKIDESKTFSSGTYSGETIYVVANYQSVPNVAGQYVANVLPPLP